MLTATENVHYLETRFLRKKKSAQLPQDTPKPNVPYGYIIRLVAGHKTMIGGGSTVLQN